MIWVPFILFFTLLFYGLWKDSRVKKQRDEDLRWAFKDNYNNYYAAVEWRGKKILLKTPDEVSQFNLMNRQQRNEMLDQSEKRAKEGKLEKVVINGAIGYLAKGKKIKAYVDKMNSLNEKQYD